jgi:hypothetical protein
MTLIAKTSPGGAEWLSWDTEGDEGAIEVEDNAVANRLLAFPEHFYVVDSKKKSPKVEESKDEKKAKAKEDSSSDTHTATK